MNKNTIVKLRTMALAILLSCVAPTSFSFGGSAGPSGPLLLASNNGTVSVKWKRVPLEQVDKICRQHGVTESYKMGACAILKGNRCLIVAPVPTGWRDNRNMAIVGHELMHCFGADHRATRASRGRLGAGQARLSIFSSDDAADARVRRWLRRH